METATAPGRRGARDASRSAILSAAFDLVAEVGYAKLTMDAIAARARVGKQTIYRSWPSKGAVLLDSFMMLTEGGEAGSAGLPDTGDLEADLRVVLHATVREFNDARYDAPLRALTIAILQDDALAAIYHERLAGPTRGLKIDRLRAAQLRGEIRSDVDLDAAADALFAPIAQRWLLRGGPLTEEYVDTVLDVALRGLR